MDRLNGNPEKLAVYITQLKASAPTPVTTDTPATAAADKPVESVPEVKINKEEPKMSEKGNCPGCGRSGVAIVAHGFCSACYPYAKKVKWDVAKVQEWRKEHPVIIRSPKGIHKTKPSRQSTKNRASVPVQPPPRVIPSIRTKTWLDVQIEEQIGRLQEMIKESGFRRAKVEAVIEITVKDVRVSLIP